MLDGQSAIHHEVLIRLTDALVELLSNGQTLPLIILAALLAWAIYRMGP